MACIERIRAECAFFYPTWCSCGEHRLYRRPDGRFAWGVAGRLPAGAIVIGSSTEDDTSRTLAQEGSTT